MVDRAKFKDPYYLMIIESAHISPEQMKYLRVLHDDGFNLTCGLIASRHVWNNDWKYCPLCGAGFETIDENGEPRMLHRDMQ